MEPYTCKKLIYFFSKPIAPLSFNRFWVRPYPYQLALLLLLWALLQLILYTYFGIKQSVDTPMYVSDAQALLEGEALDNHSFWYMGYSSILALVFWFGGSLEQVAWLQIALSGLATCCLYQLLVKITDKPTAFLGTLLYLLWAKIQFWNIFLYTESVFTSLCIISFWALISSQRWWHYALCLPLFLFTFFIRPTGYSLILALLAYAWVAGSHKNILSKGMQVVVFSLVALAALLLLNYMLKNFGLMESYAKAELIYPNISLGLTPPASLHIPSPNHPPLLRLLLFIFYNPLYFCQLAGAKFLLFFGNVRPYFSSLHNLFIVVVLYPLYAFALAGIRQFPALAKPALAFILFFILVNGATVTLTSENWDGRFLVPVLPFVFMLSAVGIRTKLLPFLAAKLAKFQP